MAVGISELFFTLSVVNKTRRPRVYSSRRQESKPVWLTQRIS